MRGRRLAVALSAAAAAALWAAVPRRACLRGFHPEGMARLETRAWRDYYVKRRLSLAVHLYQVSREEMGFSPLDSARLAWYSADAAIVFKRSKSDAEADLARPALRRYFQLLRDHGDLAFDVDAATREELSWWKIRRHDVGPVAYGHVIARAAAALYGITPDQLERYAQRRAEAMDYRDRRGEAMQDSDWSHVEGVLGRAFGELKAVVGR